MKLIFTSKIKLFQIGCMILLLIHANAAFGQLVPISLAQRIENSTTIIEGRVVSQTAYWDETKTHIYTSNVIEVYKIFKGQLASHHIEMITMGGLVGNRMEQVTNSLQLKIGDIGLFTAIANTAAINTTAKLTKLKPYAGIQGFIKYDVESGTAADMFNTYKDLSRAVYSKIVDHTKVDFKVIQKTSFKTQ